MSFFDQTVYGAVTMSVIKQTESWKSQCNSSGQIPTTHLFNQVIEQALYELGYDNSVDPSFNKKKRYTKEKFQNVRSGHNPRVVFNTTVFRFPVRKDFKYKDIYNKYDIVHFGDENFTGWNKSHVKMDEFGNSYQNTYTRNNINEECEG